MIRSYEEYFILVDDGALYSENGIVELTELRLGIMPG